MNSLSLLRLYINERLDPDAMNAMNTLTPMHCFDPDALLKKVSSRIINEVRGINRVTYDVSSKPPATIEWK